MSEMKTHWAGYLAGLDRNPKPTSTLSLPQFETTSSKIGVSGFLDLKPTSTSAQQFQANYDAMSGSWQGVHASEKATLKAKTDHTEFMPFSLTK
jgi:hypothetical protein